MMKDGKGRLRNRRTAGPDARERVLQAAAECFALRGFRGASTRELARRARVSEVTLFRLFKTKQDLYLKVLDEKLEVATPEWLRSVLETSGDDRETFTRLAEELQVVFTPTVLRLLVFGAMERPDLLDRLLRPRLSAFYRVLGDHLQRRMQAGALTERDPLLTGRALVALVFYHQLLSEVLGGRHPELGAEEEAPRVYSEIWMDGALAARFRPQSASEYLLSKPPGRVKA
jgi:TetR/AcrR family transcriptional regulator